MVGQRTPGIVALSGMGTMIFAGVMTWYGFPKLIDMRTREGVSLEPGTEAYSMWENVPFPLKTKAYIFNVMNPDEVHNGGLPIVKEMGPYVYDTYIRRVKAVINKETDTITYYGKKIYKYNAEETGCRSENDDIVVLNAALVGTALMVHKLMPTALSMVQEAVPHIFPGAKDIFLRTKVKNLLFNGITIDCSSEETEMICSSLDGVAPETFRKHENDRDWLFSMFSHDFWIENGTRFHGGVIHICTTRSRDVNCMYSYAFNNQHMYYYSNILYWLNDSEVGPYEIGRGMKNTSRGRVYKFKDEPNVGELWHSPECNLINGTDNTMFHPIPVGQSPPDIIHVFQPDVCRSFRLEKEGYRTPHGIPVTHYAIPETLFRAPKDVKCFCPRIKNEDTLKQMIKCPPAGTLDISDCMKSPILFSWPHFYMGDEALHEYVTGLHPDKEKHENFIEIEPISGTPVRGAKRAQFNMHLRKMPDFDMMANLTEGIMPILWLDEGSDLPPKFQAKLHEAYLGLKLIEYIKYYLMGQAIFLLLLASILMVKRDKLFCFSESKIEDMSNIRDQTIETRKNSDIELTKRNSDVLDFDFNNVNPNFLPQITYRNGVTRPFEFQK